MVIKNSIELILFVLLVNFFNFSANGQNQSSFASEKTDDEMMTDLFRNSYGFYQKIRHTNGAYFDMFTLESTTDRGSVANIGMGLMSLCVGHEMGWEPEAEAMVIQTLKAVSGDVPGFYLPRTAKGCFIHFYDINTGKARGTNYSPIDTDLLLGGALLPNVISTKTVKLLLMLITCLIQPIIWFL